jgi:FMN-dependent NADH-azoreductase
VEVKVLDLQEVLATKHVNNAYLTASWTPKDNQTPEQTELNEFRFGLINQIVGAKAIALSTGMHNWNIPSVLKSYIDMLIFVGVLDPYSVENKKLVGKKVALFTSYGGAGYVAGDDTRKMELNHVGKYLKQVFNLLGASESDITGKKHGQKIICFD